MRVTRAANGDELDIRRRRLAYRATHRGIKEMDLILGAFVERRIETLDTRGLDDLERLLEEPDQDLFGWISGSVPVPATHDTDIMAALKAFRFTPDDYVATGRGEQ